MKAEINSLIMKDDTLEKHYIFQNSELLVLLSLMNITQFYGVPLPSEKDIDRAAAIRILQRLMENGYVDAGENPGDGYIVREPLRSMLSHLYDCEKIITAYPEQGEREALFYCKGDSITALETEDGRTFRLYPLNRRMLLQWLRDQKSFCPPVLYSAAEVGRMCRADPEVKEASEMIKSHALPEDVSITRYLKDTGIKGLISVREGNVNTNYIFYEIGFMQYLLKVRDEPTCVPYTKEIREETIASLSG